jgi:hypothetical protein
MRTATPRVLHNSTSGENLGLEMDVSDDRDVAAALAQTFDDVLEIARILHRRRGDPDNFTASLCQLDRLLDRRLGVHRVTGNH